MHLCYSEYHTPFVKLSISIEKQLYSGRSDFQQIDVFESKEFGRFLVLDGYMMFTEKDEFIYHEMMVHIPMAVLSSAKNVLVTGGGDGGAVRELLRYKSIERIDLVEIDSKVTDVCKKYFPSISNCLDDNRVRIFNEDASKFINGIVNEYDFIIVDSTDPFGPGEQLFSKIFYENCFAAMKDTGIMVNQHANPFYDNDVKIMQDMHKRIIDIFPLGLVYQAHIPTYSSGHWLFGFASKKLHPISDLNATKWNLLGIKTKYYNTKLHEGAFALPSYVLELLRSAR